MELSLALGRPISELRRTLTHADFATYAAYTGKHGPLSTERMFDRPAALISYLLAKIHGGTPSGLGDFMPQFRPPTEADLLAQLEKD